MACKKLAKLSAALNAVRALYAVGELDSRWEPSTRDHVLTGTVIPISNAVECVGQLSRSQSVASSLATESNAESELSELLTTCNPEVIQDRTSVGLDGSSRRRRYYYRKVGIMTVTMISLNSPNLDMSGYFVPQGSKFS